MPIITYFPALLKWNFRAEAWAQLPGQLLRVWCTGLSCFYSRDSIRWSRQSHTRAILQTHQGVPVPSAISSLWRHSGLILGEAIAKTLETEQNRPGRCLWGPVVTVQAIANFALRQRRKSQPESHIISLYLLYGKTNRIRPALVQWLYLLLVSHLMQFMIWVHPLYDDILFD